MNIWISYLITGELKVLAEIISSNKLKIYHCDELITELKRVLSYPYFAKKNINIRLAVQTIKDVSIAFELTKPIKKYLPTDPDDNYVIALALQTNSGFVTSGDKDILSQKDTLENKFKKLKIITKTEFETMF